MRVAFRRRVAPRVRLSVRVRKLAENGSARLGAVATGLGAETAVVVLVGVEQALSVAVSARASARFHDSAEKLRVASGAPRQEPRGDDAEIRAVEIHADATAESDEIGFAEARIDATLASDLTRGASLHTRRKRASRYVGRVRCREDVFDRLHWGSYPRKLQQAPCPAFVAFRHSQQRLGSSKESWKRPGNIVRFSMGRIVASQAVEHP